MLRRLSALVLIAALTFGLAGPAFAQAVQPQQYTLAGPGGIIAWSTASVTVANTAGEYCIFCYTIPAGFMATSTATNQTPSIATTLPLHLTMLGQLSTSLGGTGTAPTLSVGVNFGGSTATMALVNNIPLSQVSGRPMKLDVWLSPIASATAGGNTVYLSGRFTYWTQANGSACGQPGFCATETTFNASVVGTTAITSAQQLAVNFRFGSATTTNAGTFYNRSLIIGN